MITNPKSTVRWPMILGFVGVLFSMLACMVSGPKPTLAPDPSTLRLEGSAVEVQDHNGEWAPLAVQSTFEMTGILESLDPWKVAGTILQTRETTVIDEGLKAGDLVKVRGIILDDGTWVAYSIQRAGEQAQPTIILIGRVTSMDPWIVNGITLNVTGDTVVTGDIAVGMLVRVEILLSEDGTWEVISIAPLSDVPETSGCVTVLATIVSVSGSEVQFLGWPSTVTLNVDIESGNNNTNGTDNTNEGTAAATTWTPGQDVLVVLCSTDGQIVIVQITVVVTDDGVAEPPEQQGEKVLICHKPDKNGGHTLSVAAAAVPAHLAHGDTLGACP